MTPRPEAVERSYADFELWILPPTAPASPDSPPLYPTLVTNSPAGTATGGLQLAVQSEPFAGQWARVAGRSMNAELRRQFGRTLFDTLFTGDVGRCWTESLLRIRDRADVAGLRLLLSIRAPELMPLPWELLFDGENALAAASNRSVARYLPVPEPPLAAPVDRLRVLLVVQSPDIELLPAIPQDAQDRLAAAIREALADAVDLDELRNRPFDDILHALQQDYHVLHFVGHGTAGAVYLVGDPESQSPDAPSLPREMDQDQFATLVHGHSGLRLVILNVCHSTAGDDEAAPDLFAGLGPELVQRQTPAVIAMQYQTVNLETAIQFSRGFYRSLANGLPVDVAVNEERKVLRLQSEPSRSWSTPVLYLGTRTGRILSFSLREVAAVKAAAREAARESERASAVLNALAAESSRIATRSTRLPEWLSFTDALQDLRAADETLGDSINKLSQLLSADPPPSSREINALKELVVRDWAGTYQRALTEFMGARAEVEAIMRPLSDEGSADLGTEVGAWFDEIQTKSNALRSLIEDRLERARTPGITRVINNVVREQNALSSLLRTRADDTRRSVRREVRYLDRLIMTLHRMLES